MPELPSRSAQISPAASDNIEKTAFDTASEVHRVEARTELRAARRAGMRWRLIARWLGLGIFVFGALLLGYVFWQALSGLSNLGDPGTLNREFNSQAGDSWQSMAQAAMGVFGTHLLRVLYLLILGFIASAIAARGIQFFAASEAVIDEAVLPEE